MSFKEFVEKKEGLAIFSEMFEILSEALDPNENLPRWQKRKGNFHQNPNMVSPLEKRPRGTGFEPYDPVTGQVFFEPKEQMPYDPKEIKGGDYGDAKVSQFLDFIHNYGQRQGFDRQYDGSKLIDDLLRLPEIKRMVPPLQSNPYAYLYGLLRTAAKNSPEQISLNNNTVVIKDPGISGKFYKKPASQMIGDEETGNRKLAYGVVPPKQLKQDFNPKSMPVSPNVTIMNPSKIPHANIGELKTALQQAAKLGDFNLAKKIVHEIKYRAEGINPVTSNHYDDKPEAENLYIKILDSDKYKVFA